jgi:hypothetical protein
MRFGAALLGLWLGIAGCASKLETGYQPRTLGSSAEMRRGYYAERFSPEAQKAKQYEQDFGAPSPARRPGD